MSELASGLSQARCLPRICYESPTMTTLALTEFAHPGAGADKGYSA